MSNLQVNGATLECVERGDGEPVVFVHGSASDYRTWQAQLDFFAMRYRAIAYSRRYHWPNALARPSDEYSMDQHVADLAALLAARHAAPACVVGHSYGAFVALLLAMREPRLVGSLVLAEPPLVTLFMSNAPSPAEIVRLLVTRPRTAAALIRLGATGIGPATRAARRGDMNEAMRLMGRAVLGPASYRRLSATRLAQVRANAIAGEFLGSGFPRLEAAMVRALRLPVLLPEGERSPALFRRINDRLAALLPHAARVRIPSASHLMHEDSPHAFNDALAAHLEAARATQSVTPGS